MIFRALLKTLEKQAKKVVLRHFLESFDKKIALIKRMLPPSKLVYIDILATKVPKKKIRDRHYEAKLCILCIVSGFRNRPKSILSRYPQQCYFSLIFYAVLVSTNKYVNYCAAQNRSKNMPNCGIRNSICGIQNSLWNPQTNDKTFVSLN